MNPLSTNSVSRTRRGQTIVIALIVLGVLLALGFVFIGLINRGIQNAGSSRQRSIATDLAEAGVRFAHAQMLNSEQGADWRPSPSVPLSNRDPDLSYLRPAPGVSDPSDYGGPDRLGPYSRVDFDNGRALIRVHYGPSDANVFTRDPSGSLRNPGRARNYLRIESIGRPGRVRANDPTTTLENSRVESKKVIAFAAIGVIENARTITNKDRVARPADIGVPIELGATYATAANTVEQVQVPLQLGTAGTLFNFVNGQPTLANIEYGGSIFSNAPLRIFGEVRANLNVPLGDGIRTSQTIKGADDASQLTLRVATADIQGSGNWNATAQFQPTNNTNPSMDSYRNTFSTFGGLIRDGLIRTDGDGYTRGVGTIEPPSILRVDPDTRQNRYLTMTRDSGRLTVAGNGGSRGHGRNVYVSNRSDRQIRGDEDGRATAGTNESLVYDWLNPNNGQAGSGWTGPYYVPRGAVVQLNPDGFTISRDPRGPDNERTWRMEAGGPSLRPGANAASPGPGDAINSSIIRYRIRFVGGRPYILNSFTVNRVSGTVIDINAALSDDVFTQSGMVFGGVLYFEGNARVRGVIPTDVQLTLVSNATIYIDGSITKGVVLGNSRLTRPSRSMLALFAKEYVAVNTTQFFGPNQRVALEESGEVPSGVAWNSVRMRQVAGGGLGFRTEFLLNPEVTGPNAFNPSSWQPYTNNYRQGVSAVGAPLRPYFLMSHAMDDGAGPATFLSMDINFGLPSSTYNFPLSNSNSATQFYRDNGFAGNWAPIYGLGATNWQRSPKFESIGFAVTDANSVFDSGALTLSGGAATPMGQYTIRVQDTNDVSMRPNFINGAQSNDFLLGRFAVVPHDIRIEAAIYAEEGSFFVIPGPWYNPNVNDRRDVYLAAVDNYQSGGLSPADARQAAQRDRLENFGAWPEMPFYGEPLAVRVQIIGAISENMPPPISQQAEWIRKWGWIPRNLGATDALIPQSWVPNGYNLNTNAYVPNFVVGYDPALATGRTQGFVNTTSPTVDSQTLIRADEFGRPLPPLPRLPVSPSLAFFGEVNP
jgi:hypothetical protein